MHRLSFRGNVVKCSCGWRYERPLLLGYHAMTNRAIRKHFETARP